MPAEEDESRFFTTAHLHANLKGRSIRGGAVTLANQVIKFVIQIGSTAILARLLTPTDFGLVAMVSVVTGFLGTFGDLGLSSATVQRAEISQEQVSTLFWINVGVGLLITALIAAFAPVIAWFYHEPRLMWIMLVAAGGFIFSGLPTQHYALLTRQMRFGAMAVVQTLPLVVSTLVGIGLALAGWRYWSLVVMGVVWSAVAALVSWIASGWIPGLPSRASGVGSMLAIGGHLTGFSILNYLTRNADNVLIGRFLGPGPLGTYAKAYALLIFPVQQINAPLNGVVLPALSRLQNYPDLYRRYFLRAVEGVAFIGMPIIIFAFADARPLVLTLLGSKWLGAIEIFRLLAPAALVGTIDLAPAWIFTSLGKTNRQFLWAVISSPIILAGFIIGMHWGAGGVAASYSITFGLCFAAFMVDACRHSPIRIRDFLFVLILPFLLSVAAATIMSLAGNLLHFPVAVRLVFDGVVFCTCYSSIGLVFPGGQRVWRMFHGLRTIPSPN